MEPLCDTQPFNEEERRPQVLFHSTMFRERWLVRNPYLNTCNFIAIQQPEPGRIALKKYWGTGYWYADELPSWIRCITAATIIFSILATPLILLCCLPLLHYMKQVSLFWK